MKHYAYYVTLLALFTVSFVTANEDKKTLEQLFFDAAHKGDISKLEKCLKNKEVKITATDDKKNTVLHYAAVGGHLAIIERILKGQEESGWFYSSIITIDLNEQNEDGQTPLQLAAEHGHENIVKRLLKGYIEEGYFSNSYHQASIHIADKLGNKPIHIAATPAILTLLKNNGADIEEENKEQHRAIEVAAKKGNIPNVLHLLELGAQIMPKKDKRSTVLHIAFKTKNINLAKIFVLNKELLNARDQFGETPLMIATLQYNDDFFQLALDHNADVTIADSYGNTPLHIVSRPEIIKLLKHRGAVIDARNSQGITPLHDAAKYGNLQKVDILLSFGAFINSKDNKGFTPLAIAALENNISVCEYLLSKNANPKEENNDGHNLFAIILDGDSDELLKLIQGHKDFDINFLDKNGMTALTRAIKNIKAKKVQQLIQLNANVCTINAQGETSLHVATRYGTREMVQDILNANPAILEMRNKQKQTALITALENKASFIALDLIKAESQIFIIDANNNTPLDYALKHNLFDIVPHLINTEVMKYHNDHQGRALHSLLKQNVNSNVMQEKVLTIMQKMSNCGASLNIVDHNGNAPIHTAIYNNNTYIVKWLLQQGINPNSCNSSGMVPLMIAAQQGDTVCANILLSHKATINIQDYNGYTAFTYATFFNQITMMRFLYNHGASQHYKDNNGNTLLHVAAEKGNKESLEFLSSIGISHDSKNNLNQTPLMSAIDKDQVSSVEFFLTKMQPLTITTLENMIRQAPRFGHVRDYLEKIKTQNIDECQRILKTQNELNTLIGNNEALRKTLRDKLGNRPELASQEHKRTHHTIDNLMKLLPHERNTLSQLLQQSISHVINETKKLEQIHEQIQKQTHECQRILKTQNELNTLIGNNEALRKTLRDKLGNRPELASQEHKRTHHTIDNLMKLLPHERTSLSQLLQQSISHEINETKKLEKILEKAQEIKHKQPDPVAPQIAPAPKAVEEEKQEERQCLSCKKHYSTGNFVTIKKGDDAHTPCIQCLKKHQPKEGSENSKHTPCVCKQCFKRHNENKDNLCIYCKKPK